MPYNMKMNIPKTKQAHPVTQVQTQVQTHSLILGRPAARRNCATLKVQGKKSCSSCGHK